MAADLSPSGLAQGADAGSDAVAGTHANTVKVALAQISPVYLNREETLKKVIDAVREASKGGASIMATGEALVPGGAIFGSQVQKDLFARYADQAVTPELGHLEGLQEAAKQHGVTVILGMIERPLQRSGTSLYCSIAYIDGGTGTVKAIHRKIMPTFEERLVWSAGDGAGIVTHPHPTSNGTGASPWVVGALNCYETWLPLMRAALHAQGENLHFSLWPGCARNTRDMTRFYALEGRSFAVSVSAVMKWQDVRRENVPHYDLVVGGAASLGAAVTDGSLEAAAKGSEAQALSGTAGPAADVILDGGSCVAGPSGEWLLSPEDTCDGEEGVFIVEVDHRHVLQERQCLDISGHYSRPDILQLQVHRSRQATAMFHDGPGSAADTSLNPAPSSKFPHPSPSK